MQTTVRKNRELLSSGESKVYALNCTKHDVVCTLGISESLLFIEYLYIAYNIFTTPTATPKKLMETLWRLWQC